MSGKVTAKPDPELGRDEKQMKPKTLLLSALASLLLSAPALAGTDPFPPPPPKPPAPPLTRNCKPRGFCVLACIHNEDGSHHDKWHWMSWAEWLKYKADHPDAYLYLGTLDTRLCASYNGFFIQVGNGWDGFAPSATVTFTVPADPGDPFAIYAVITDTLTEQ